MVLIRDIVRQAIATGYLSITAEDQLRQLLATKYDLEDFYAFMDLQQAAMAGQVRQESRERRRLYSLRDREEFVRVKPFYKSAVSAVSA